MVGIGNAATTATIIKDGDLNMGAYDIKTDDVKESSSGHGVDVDGVLIKDDAVNSIDAVGGSVLPKEVSANLRNSHNAEAHHGTNDASYHLLKTMTFTYGIKGNLRVKFDRKANGAYVVYGRLYKNGVALGTADGGSDQTYTEFSEDVDVGTVAPGETLQMYGKAEAAGAEIWIKDFQLYYDNLGGAATVVNT
jgi:hypothetical protein